MRKRIGLAVGMFTVGALMAAFVRSWSQDAGESQHAAPERMATCRVRSAVVMPVSEMKAFGYANNARVLVDSRGNAWLTVRSKRDGGDYGVCLVRVPPPWSDALRAEQTWLEDRDSLQLSGAPQRVAAIAAGNDSTIHMAWYGGSGSAAEDHQVRYARFSTGGATRIEEERTPFTVPGFEDAQAAAGNALDLWQEHAALTTTPDGRVWLVWEARDPWRRSTEGQPKPGIALVRRGTDGTWTRYGLGRPPYLQVNEQFPSQSRPSIVADTGGTVHVICYGSVSGTQQILHGSFAPGENFSGWEVIAPSGGDQRHGALAVDRSGRLHVAWREGVQPGRNGGAVAAIFYSVRETDGRWRRPVRLTGDDEDASTPSVGVTDSTVSVAWIAWAPGTANSEGQVDNGFPADHSTVEGRVEVTSSPIGPTHFDAPAVIDPGPASYPCWAVTARAGDPRPPLAWTSRDVGSGAMSLKLGWCERGR